MPQKEFFLRGGCVFAEQVGPWGRVWGRVWGRARGHGRRWRPRRPVDAGPATVQIAGGVDYSGCTEAQADPA